jgi:hypothetical protein
MRQKKEKTHSKLRQTENNKLKGKKEKKKKLYCPRIIQFVVVEDVFCKNTQSKKQVLERGSFEKEEEREKEKKQTETSKRNAALVGSSFTFLLPSALVLCRMCFCVVLCLFSL